MGLDNTTPGAGLVDQAVRHANRIKDFKPLLGLFGGDQAPQVPLLLAWLAHMACTHSTQHDDHETRLQKTLRGALKHPQDRPDIGLPADDRLWDLLASHWGDAPTAGALSARRALELHLVRMAIGLTPGDARSVHGSHGGVTLRLLALLVNRRKVVTTVRLKLSLRH